MLFINKVSGWGDVFEGLELIHFFKQEILRVFDIRPRNIHSQKLQNLLAKLSRQHWVEIIHK